MSIYDSRPWLARYNPDRPHDIEVEFPNALDMFKAALARGPDHVLVRYFDGALTVREVDELTDSYAAGLLANGFEAGDRLGVYLQNVPQFVLTMLATWKAGGIMVSINPMNKDKELKVLLDDSGASVLVCHPNLYQQFGTKVVPDSKVRLVLTTSELEYQTSNDERLFAGMSKSTPDGALDLLEFIAGYQGQQPPAVELKPEDVALLTYTSGTTGPPKGAMTTHRNIVFNSQSYRDWVGLGSDDVILGVAPLFHITGLIGHITISFLLPATLVLAYRFDPDVMLETIRERRPTFTVGSITVFISLMNAPNAKHDDLASLTKIYSGGAPIPPSTVQEFQKHFGHYIHNIYGLTETTSPSHGVPFGSEAPVDKESGALSVGVPIFNTIVRIVGDDGNDLPAGEVGELVKAYVSLRAGQEAQPEAIIAFCKERMAAYKYPRLLEIIDEVPKTVTGKVLRRELRTREG
jgi:long-chain acyl-CoA synthetase